MAESAAGHRVAFGAVSVEVLHHYCDDLSISLQDERCLSPKKLLSGLGPNVDFKRSTAAPPRRVSRPPLGCGGSATGGSAVALIDASIIRHRRVDTLHTSLEN